MPTLLLLLLEREARKEKISWEADYAKKCSAEGCTNNSRDKEGLCRRHGGQTSYWTDDEEDKKKLEQIVENAIPIGKVGETFSAEVSYLHFFILLIF